MRDASDHGQTPLSDVWIIGHGRRQGKEVGSQAKIPESRFSVQDFAGAGGIDAFTFLPYTDAERGYLSVGFWFSRKADVRFIGCFTSNMAHVFGSHVLRPGATAYGTDEEVYPFVERGNGLDKKAMAMGKGRILANERKLVQERVAAAKNQGFTTAVSEDGLEYVTITMSWGRDGHFDDDAPRAKSPEEYFRGRVHVTHWKSHGGKRD